MQAVRQERSPGALAFLGDAVWELHVRQRQVAAPGRLQDYYAAARAEACAEAQASCHDWLLGQEGLLTDEEREVLRWGRNASGTVPRRIAAGKLDKRTYRKATAFECLLGVLHLADPGRAATLLERLVGALGRLPT